MKKIILLLCLVMFMCVNAKHNKLNDDNPNATVTVQLNFIKQKENNVKSSNTGILSIDNVSIHKGLTFHTSYFHSIKIEPGIHTIGIYYRSGKKYATVPVKYDFKPNQTYYIDIFNDYKKIYTKVRNAEETE